MTPWSKSLTHRTWFLHGRSLLHQSTSRLHPTNQMMTFHPWLTRGRGMTIDPLSWEGRVSLPRGQPRRKAMPSEPPKRSPRQERPAEGSEMPKYPQKKRLLKIDPPEGPVPAATPPRADEEEEDETQPGLMEALESIPVAETSLHPHRQVEDLIKDPTKHAG